MRSSGCLTGLAVAALTAACAPFGAPHAPAPLAVQGDGYLSAARHQALADAVPAPPAQGSAVDLDDRAASLTLRPLEGGDRWLLATAHAELKPDLARQHFDCALGVRFAATATPRLTALLARLMADANDPAEMVKARAPRPRPIADPDRPACQRVTPASRTSASYPSGSAAIGAAFAEAMAAVDPEHAPAAREIGRQIGVSREVCAMHWRTDVTAGAELGRRAFGLAASTPAFRDDLAAARAELSAVRATGLTNPGCAAERAALALLLPSSAARP